MTGSVQDGGDVCATAVMGRKDDAASPGGRAEARPSRGDAGMTGSVRDGVVVCATAVMGREHGAASPGGRAEARPSKGDARMTGSVREEPAEYGTERSAPATGADPDADKKRR